MGSNYKFLIHSILQKFQFYFEEHFTDYEKQVAQFKFEGIQYNLFPQDVTIMINLINSLEELSESNKRGEV